MASADPTSLLVSDDPRLVEEVMRLAAAADVAVEVAGSSRAQARWKAASLVLVGSDAVAALAELGAPRGSRTVVVAHTPVPEEAYRGAIALGATSVVELPRSGDWLLDLLAAADDVPLASSVVGVAGGAGGVGATVFSAALALVAAGRRLLVDLDHRGAGQRRLHGLEGHPGATWSDLTENRGRFAAALCAKAWRALESWGCSASPRDVE